MNLTEEQKLEGRKTIALALEWTNLQTRTLYEHTPNPAMHVEGSPPGQLHRSEVPDFYTDFRATAHAYTKIVAEHEDGPEREAKHYLILRGLVKDHDPKWDTASTEAHCLARIANAPVVLRAQALVNFINAA